MWPLALHCTFVPCLVAQETQREGGCLRSHDIARHGMASRIILVIIAAATDRRRVAVQPSQEQGRGSRGHWITQGSSPGPSIIPDCLVLTLVAWARQRSGAQLQERRIRTV